MYKCLCYSCEEEDLQETLKQAQAFFTDHLDRGHHPEIIKLDAELPKMTHQTDG